MGQLLAALFAILIGISSIPTFISYQSQSNENVKSAATAKQAGVMIAAYWTYLQQNATTLQSSTNPTTPVVVSVAQLQAAKALDASFAATTPYRQTWQMQVLQPSAGNLQALVVTTGGTALPDRLANKIAALISGSTGKNGGFIPKNDSGVYPAGNAYGAFSQWKVSTANYTGVTGGQLAALLTFNSSQLGDNRLYRNQVPGQPQLNTMTTPLIMASSQTVGADCSAAGPFAIAQDGNGAVVSCLASDKKWHTQGSAYWQDPVPNLTTLNGTYPCTAATAWQTRIVEVPSVGSGPRGYTCNGSSWQPLALDDAGNLTVPGMLTAGKFNLQKVANENDPCNPAVDGNQAMSPAGLLLTCQSGVFSRQAPSARAWVSFAGNACTPGCPINSAWNISSVTRIGVGQYAVTFTTALPSAMYGVIGSSWNDLGAGHFVQTGFQSSAGFNAYLINTANGYSDSALVFFSVFGG